MSTLQLYQLSLFFAHQCVHLNGPKPFLLFSGKMTSLFLVIFTITLCPTHLTVLIEEKDLHLSVVTDHIATSSHTQAVITEKLVNEIFSALYFSVLQYKLIHFTTLKFMHCSALHCTTMHLMALHYTTVYNTTLKYTTLDYTALQCTTLHYAELHYTTLHFTHYNVSALCCPTLH